MSHSKRIKEDGNTGASEGNSNGSSASDNNANHHDLSGDGKIVIIDFGSQFTHIIARRIRELHVYCDLFSCLTTLENLLTSNSSNHMNGNNNNAKTEVPSKIVGVILSGGPASIYEEGAPRLRKDIWKYLDENKIPVLGICYGMCEMAVHYGGRVAASAKREYGLSRLKRAPENTSDDPLLGKILDHEDDVVWMSHGDKVEELPAGFQPIACTENGKFAAIMGPAGSNRFAFQFHPEVTHSVHGKEMLKNFVVGICNAPTNWNMKNIAEDFVENIRKIVGPHDHVIGAVSGGVDSSVAAVLLNKAIGDRFHAVLVDNGCLRLNEAKLVHERLTKVEKMDLIVVDAADRFMAKLKGVEDPEKKRKIIGNEFIEIFQEEANRLKKEKLPEGQSIKYLLQGTLYPDVIESLSYKGPSATIKTHHNVGGLPAKMDLKLIEPLRELFKDEVRELGIALGLDPESVWRHPFPGPGLAIRILGEVTKEKADKLRHADDIMIQEIRNAGIYNEISQAFVVLLPVKSVGVMGDHRTYEEVAAVRCVTTTDFMTADWYHMDPKLMSKISSRIINEVNGFNRVVYDISSKPPSTIEWEQLSKRRC